MAFLEEYTLLDELGQGGFATVYKVRHNTLGYIRAIRVLNAIIAKGDSDPAYQKFLEECRLLLRLGNGNHPNIVHIYQPLLKAQRAIVEMDYIDGKDIYQYMVSRNFFVPMEDVMNLLQNIGSALAYCHHDIYKFCMDRDEDNLQDDPNDGSKILIDEATHKRLVHKYRVIHNDIHSGNILRREDGTFVLLDFGLAIEGDNVVRSSRRKNGAPEFKAPEKWDNDALLSTQSDIYSFGVVLYEFLAGRVPFVLDKTNSNIVEAEYLLSKAHSGEPPQPIFELRKAAFERSHPGQSYVKDYPDWLEQLIMKCLAKSAADRFVDGRELFDFVKQNMATLPVAAAPVADNALQAKFASLEAEKAQIIEQMQTYQQQMQTYQQQMTEYNQKVIAAHEAEKTELQQKIDNLQQRVEQLQIENNALIAQLQALQESISKSESDTVPAAMAETMRVELQAAKDEIALLKKQSKTLAAQNEELKQRLVFETEQKAKLADDLKAAQQSVQSAQGVVAPDLSGELSEAKQKSEALATELKALLVKYDALQGENAKLKKSAVAAVAPAKSGGGVIWKILTILFLLAAGGLAYLHFVMGEKSAPSFEEADDPQTEVYMEQESTEANSGVVEFDVTETIATEEEPTTPVEAAVVEDNSRELELQALLVEKQAEIDALKTTVAELETEIEALQKSSNKKSSKADKEALAQKDKEIKQLKNQIEAKDKEIANLESKIKKLLDNM